jgi:hypothetical protein
MNLKSSAQHVQSCPSVESRAWKSRTRWKWLPITNQTSFVSAMIKLILLYIECIYHTIAQDWNSACNRSRTHV